MMMRKKALIIATIAAASLAVPSAAIADEFTGVSTNGTARDYVGYAVSAGNFNYHQAGLTTGQNRKEYNATHDGGFSTVIQAVLDSNGTLVGPEVPYAPPGPIE